MTRVLALLAVVLLVGCAGSRPAEPAATTLAQILLHVPPGAALDEVRARLAAEPGLVIQADSGGLVVSDPSAVGVAHLRLSRVADDITRVEVRARHPALSSSAVTPLGLLRALDRDTAGAIFEPLAVDPACPPDQEWLRSVREPRAVRGLPSVGGPELIGGLGQFAQQIRYPEDARRMGVQGTVLLGLVIEPDGSVPCVWPVVAVAGPLTAEALRVARTARFRPPADGVARRVRYLLPVSFRLF